MLDVFAADFELRAVGVEHVGNRIVVAGGDEIVAVVVPGELLLIGFRRCVMTVGVHVVEVEKERPVGSRKEFGGAIVDALGIVPKTAFVEDIESASEPAAGVLLAGCVADDRARRYRESAVSLLSEDLGDGRVFFRDPHLAGLLGVEVEGVARGQD